MKLNKLILSSLIVFSCSNSYTAEAINSIAKRHSTAIALLVSMTLAHKILSKGINNKLVDYYEKQSAESFSYATQADDSENFASTLNMMYSFSDFPKIGKISKVDGLKKAWLVILSVKALTGFATYALVKKALQ